MPTLTADTYARARDLAAEVCRVRLVTMETGDGWLVVSRTRDPRSVIPPYRHDYYYDHFERESDATEFYGEIERGDYSDTREAVAMVACRRGVPLGAKKVL